MSFPAYSRPIRPDIVEAAAKVFGAVGYERATLDEIASLVGMQKGSLYYHIDSKEQLLVAIHTKLFHILEGRLTEVTEAAGADPVAELSGIIRAIVEVVSFNRDAVRVVLRDRGSLSEANSRVIDKNRAAVLDTIENAVRRVRREQGTAGTGPTRVLSYGIMGMTYFVSEWFDADRQSASTIASTLSKLVIEGIGRAPPARARPRAPR